jgi:O-antigen/teichoic acid export membrane protein
MSVRKSLGYAYSAQGLNFLISFSTSILLARLLTPREFGIFAMAAATSAIFNLFFAFSLANYIVREPVVDTALLRSAFTVNAALTLVLAVLIHLAGWGAILFFDAPEVGRVLRLFAIVPLISMFEFIPSALCARGMRFKLSSSIGVVKNLTLSFVTVALAWSGFHEMSFVWGTILSAIFSVILYNMREWHPEAWQPRLAGFRKITGFGLQMMSIQGLSQLSSRAGELLLGSMLGLRMLGLYNRASNLSSQVYNNVYGIGASVVFTKLSRDLREHGAFHDTFLKALSVLLAVIWPITIGVALLSAPVIQRLYGAQWLDAAWPLSLLMIAFFISLGTGMAWEVFVLRKETRLQMRIEVTRSSVGFLLFLSGAAISLTAAAGAKVLESILTYVLYRRHMDRLVGAAPGELRRVYLLNLKLTAVAIAPTFALMIWWRWSPLTPLPAIFAAVLAGVGGWTTFLFSWKHPLAQEVTRLLASRSRRSPEWPSARPDES